MAIMTATHRRQRYEVLIVDGTMVAQQPRGVAEVARRLHESCFWSETNLLTTGTMLPATMFANRFFDDSVDDELKEVHFEPVVDGFNEW
jgi:hypothetical protein